MSARSCCRRVPRYLMLILNSTALILGLTLLTFSLLLLWDADIWLSDRGDLKLVSSGFLLGFGLWLATTGLLGSLAACRSSEILLNTHSILLLGYFILQHLIGVGMFISSETHKGYTKSFSRMLCRRLGHAKANQTDLLKLSAAERPASGVNALAALLVSTSTDLDNETDSDDSQLNVSSGGGAYSPGGPLAPNLETCTGYVTHAINTGIDELWIFVLVSSFVLLLCIFFNCIIVLQIRRGKEENRQQLKASNLSLRGYDGGAEVGSFHNRAMMMRPSGHGAVTSIEEDDRLLDTLKMKEINDNLYY